METHFSTTIVIFGITGDLAQKKILPALYDLYTKGEIDKYTRIVGFSRRSFTDEEIRAFVASVLPHRHMSDLSDFLAQITYVQGNFDSSQSYTTLAEHVARLDTERRICSNKLFYLSVPPTLYENILTHISESGLSIPCGGDLGFARILIEKPFGNDLGTAEKLDALLGKLFKEEQIFRIDHYLAKESLTHMIDTRRTDPELDALWNRDYIDRVDINLFETVDVDKRALFFDPVGALRDVGQNHMLQMLALVAMDIPRECTAEAIQHARAETLSQLISRVDTQGVIRGQYTGYRELPDIDPHSDTETFFTLPVFINNARFAGVPFVLTSGKALSRKETSIIVYFKNGENLVFDVSAENGLIAYKKVLLDCILGDTTVFTSTKEVLAEWNFIGSVMAIWKDTPFVLYDKGCAPEKIAGINQEIN